MRRVLVGAFRCLNLAVASGLVSLTLWALGTPGAPGPGADAWVKTGAVLLALHLGALLVAVGLVITNRTGIGMAVAASPAGLFIATFVIAQTFRETLTKIMAP
jgi:hypothetical protein